MIDHLLSGNLLWKINDTHSHYVFFLQYMTTVDYSVDCVCVCVSVSVLTQQSKKNAVMKNTHDMSKPWACMSLRSDYSEIGKHGQLVTLTHWFVRLFVHLNS